jgi:hypothetical protein
MNGADFPRVALPEALARLASMPALLVEVTDRASDAALRDRAPAEEFSLGEQACHLRDVEREGYLVRLQRMLDEECPALEGFDGAAVAKARDYAAQDGREAAREFARLRAEFVTRASRLPGDAFARTGMFAGRRITLCDLLAMMVEHDRGHREDIEATARRIGAWR